MIRRAVSPARVGDVFSQLAGGATARRRTRRQRWLFLSAAFAISIVLWLRVSGTFLADQQVPTRIEWSVSDTAWSLLEAPEQVVATFRGRRGQVFTSLFQQPYIRKLIEVVNDTVLRIPISPSEVIYSADLEVRPVALDVSQVEVRLEPRTRKRVPVSAETDATAAAGAVVVGLDFAPDSVWVYGPASRVEGIDVVSAGTMLVGEIGARVTRQLIIELPPGLTGVGVEPASVVGTVQVDTLGMRTFSRAVEVVLPSDLDDYGNVEFDPSEVSVLVSGPLRILAALRAVDFRALVMLEDPPRQGASYPVELEWPRDLAVTATSDPPRVTAQLNPTSGQR
ncbi:MAG: hypothetical protein J4G03_05260 [Gemmatimonadetes bacterium]|nr:hypothetical protein [Gemmatimonadota bacterium]